LAAQALKSAHPATSRVSVALPRHFIEKRKGGDLQITD
jgi:hypothetical protein